MIRSKAPTRSSCSAGEHDGREDFGIGLAKQGWASTVVISNPYGDGDPVMKRVCRDVHGSRGSDRRDLSPARATHDARRSHQFTRRARRRTVLEEGHRRQLAVSPAEGAPDISAVFLR